MYEGSGSAMPSKLLHTDDWDVSVSRYTGKVCITLTYDPVAEQSILISKVASSALHLFWK